MATVGIFFYIYFSLGASTEQADIAEDIAVGGESKLSDLRGLTKQNTLQDLLNFLHQLSSECERLGTSCCGHLDFLRERKHNTPPM